MKSLNFVRALSWLVVLHVPLSGFVRLLFLLIRFRLSIFAGCVYLFFFFFFLLAAPGEWGSFQGQESNLHHSSNLSQSSDTTRSLTYCTREPQLILKFITPYAIPTLILIDGFTLSISYPRPFGNQPFFPQMVLTPRV